MLRIVLAGLRARPVRSLLVAAAVALSVGVLGASFVYADTATRAFYEDFARSAAGVDVWATPDDASAEPSAAAARVSAVPGVAHADLRITARLGVIGRGGRVLANGREVGLAVSAPAWPGFTPYRVVNGREPMAVDEVAVDVFTATREALRPGDQVSVLTRDDRTRRLQVVGLVDFGAEPAFADRSVLVLRADDLMAYAAIDEPPAILVAGEAGVDEETLRVRVAQALGDGYTLTTGGELRQSIAVAAAKYVSSFVTTLRATSVVALAVAVLIVYNTFQIIVTTRRREHALLRCVGAKSGQVVRLVLLESTVVGAAAAVLAAAASVGGGLLLALGQDMFGGGIPDFTLVISARSVVIPVVVGVTATLVSGVLPALTAGRVAPLAALRDAQTEAPARGRTFSRFVLAAAGAGLALGGLALMRAGHGRGFDGLVALVGGAMTVLAAAVLVLPLFVKVGAAPMRSLLGQLLGTTGRLAVDYAGRHPMRFAAATAAVMASVAPMSVFAVLLDTAQEQGARELAENFPVDFVVSKTGNGITHLPDGVVASVRATPELGTVVLSRVGSALVDGGGAAVAALEPGALGSDLALEVRDGDLGGLPPGTMALAENLATRHGLYVGDMVTLGPPDDSRTLRLVAVFDNAPMEADALINWSDFQASGLDGYDQLLIRRADGVPAAIAAAALDRAVGADPGITVFSVADRRESLAAGLAKRLTHFTVLVGCAMVIAVLGIAGSQSLSVLERTRESALLRAVGFTRRQAYAAVLVEAVLTAGIGALAGAAFGVGFGYVAARELIEFYGHGAPVVPVGRVAAYVAAAIAAAAVASLLPARRVVRASVIGAMSLDR